MIDISHKKRLNKKARKRAKITQCITQPIEHKVKEKQDDYIYAKSFYFPYGYSH